MHEYCSIFARYRRASAKHQVPLNTATLLRERAHVSSTTSQAADRRRGLANRNVLAYGGDECLGFKQTVTSLFDLLRQAPFVGKGQLVLSR
jgi:hypothetical protein